MNTEQILTELRDAQKTFVGRARADFDELTKRLDNIEADLARKAADGGGGFLPRCSGFPVRSIGDGAAMLTKALQSGLPEFTKSARWRGEVPVSAFLETKALASAGLVTAQPSPIIGAYGEFAAGDVRRLFRAVQATQGEVFAIRETSGSNFVAGSQTELSPKSESTPDLTGEALAIRTLASWLSVSKQALADVAGLTEFLRARLFEALETELETQILTGTGMGVTMTGLIPAASAFNPAYLPAAVEGWDRAAVLGAAAVQCRIQGFRPDFCILNPADHYRLRFTRDQEDRYLSYPPLPRIVESVTMPQGSFLTGDSGQALLRPRQEMTLDLSEHHANHFVENKVAIRLEMRAAFQIISERAFVYGSLDTSPA